MPRVKLVIAMNTARAGIWRWPAAATARLRSEFPTVEVAEYIGAIDRVPAVADAEIFRDADAAVGWRLNPALWRAAPRLRWIHCPSAAVNQLLTPELVASDIVVTNGASVHAATVAQHALTLVLALARALPAAVRWQAAGAWRPQDLIPEMDEVHGARALIVGMGHIGRALAPLLEALGMTVAGIGRAQAAELEARLGEADYVVLALPATGATEALMGFRQFAAMKRGARLVNVGRGASLDEPALLAALDSGQLAGAGLDVMRQEPLPADSPLWRHPRVLLTPHVAAVTPRTWQRQTDLIARHLRCFLAGEPLSPQVDKHRGY
ncbi:MAG TPA: D-2-hydroxyacid dehydrogenase [Terriglobales bacterium]|nr:D-2-hydroxyacid dehydrogenase [Terriglobales bacterium]